MSATSIDPLVALSDRLAALVAAVAPAVAVIHGRRGPVATGLVWQAGRIVTSEQALGRAEVAPVTLAGGRAAEGRLVARDPATNVAVLAVEGATAAVPEPADPAALAPGHLVLAVGAAEAGPTAALGVVHAVGPAWRSQYGGLIDRLIRLDIGLAGAAEGGPVLDAGGRLIGMSTLGPRGRVLAIPAATIERVVGRLAASGRLVRGWLGLGVQPTRLDRRVSTALGLASDAGLMVMSIEPDGPAEAAGLHVGDVLLGVAGKPLAGGRDLLGALEPESIGAVLAIDLVRGGQRLEAAVTVAERPA